MLPISEKKSVSEQKRPRIVEIIGPAGAGKTTLCKLLTRRCDIRLSKFPDVRKVTNAPFFIFYGLRLLPVWFQRCDDRRLSRREFAWLTILNGWPKILQKELRGHQDQDILLLDQGPVYLLSEISGFGPNCLKGKRTAQLWQTWYRQWAATLDAIVWLDASDETLLKRIRNRKKEHIVKAESARAAFEFLRRFRSAYEHNLSRLAVIRTDLKVFRFDTTRQSPKVIVNQLLREFDLKTALPEDRK